MIQGVGALPVVVENKRFTGLSSLDHGGHPFHQLKKFVLFFLIAKNTVERSAEG